ncbi:MAG: hypothetical protein EXS14_01035 [Planctomycetes bacterium]|nr:hypothetical protein [Planctomycetota bacterium]
MIGAAESWRRMLVSGAMDSDAALISRCNQYSIDVLWVRQKQLPECELLSMLARVAGAAKCPVIASASVQIAKRAGVFGIQLADDEHRESGVHAARACGLCVGGSAHDLSGVRLLRALAVDWIVFGPVRSTPKQGVLVSGCGMALLQGAVEEAGTIPVIAIGGLGPKDLASVQTVGAVGIGGIRCFV